MPTFCAAVENVVLLSLAGASRRRGQLVALALIGQCCIAWDHQGRQDTILAAAVVCAPAGLALSTPRDSLLPPVAARARRRRCWRDTTGALGFFTRAFPGAPPQGKVNTGARNISDTQRALCSANGCLLQHWPWTPFPTESVWQQKHSESPRLRVLHRAAPVVPHATPRPCAPARPTPLPRACT